MARTKKRSVGWLELTVDNAPRVKDFYVEVVGWYPEPVEMGGYADYNLCNPADGKPVVGVRHPRAGVPSLPPQWIPYVEVDSLETCIRILLDLGGSMVTWPRDMDEPGKRYMLIRDPAGAVMALVEHSKKARGA